METHRLQKAAVDLHTARVLQAKVALLATLLLAILLLAAANQIMVRLLAMDQARLLLATNTMLQQ